MATKLETSRGELQSKREALNEIFAKTRQSNGDYNMDAAQVEDVRAKKEELDDLHKQFKALEEIERLDRDNKTAIEAYERTPVTDVRFPSKSDEQPKFKSLGEAFAESKMVKDHSFNIGERVELSGVGLAQQFKTTMTTATGFPPENLRSGIVVPSAQRKPRLADYIPQGTTNQAAVIYMSETTFTNNAAPRAENTGAAESALAYTPVTSNVRSIAHFIPVTYEQLADVSGMRDLLDTRMIAMLRLKEEDQLITGNGTAPNLRGFLNLSGVQSQALGSDTVMDAFYKGMDLVRFTGFAEPDLAVVHPLDWQPVALAKTSEGLYIWGNPSQGGPDRLWGVPVLVTPAITQNTGLVGDFAGYSHISRRQDVTIEIGFVNTNLTDRVKTVVCEERISLESYRDTAFCKITGI